MFYKEFTDCSIDLSMVSFFSLLSSAFISFERRTFLILFRLLISGTKTFLHVPVKTVSDLKKKIGRSAKEGGSAL